MSKIVELKQLDPNSNVIQNGNYECIIQDEILLNQGDSVMLKNAFIDSSALDTDNLILNREIELNIQFIRYTTDLFMPETATRVFASTAGSNDLWRPPPTGIPLFDCMDITPSGTDLIADELYIYRDPLSGSSDWGFGQMITFQYEDWGSNIISRKHFTLPSLITTADGVLWERYVIPVNFHIKQGTFKDITPSSVQIKAGYLNLELKTSSASATKNYVPRKLQKTIKIEPGSYTPSDLAGIISEGMQKSREGQFVITSAAKSPITNTLLQPIGETLYSYNTFLCGCRGDMTADGGGPDGDKGFTFNLFDSSKDKKFNILTGSSQFGIEYDTTLNKFYFSEIHTPIFEKDGDVLFEVGQWTYDQKDIPFFQPDVSELDPYTFYKNTGGGILFTSLTAQFTDTGEIFDFWNGQLGFNTNSLTVNEKYSDVQLEFPFIGGVPSYTSFSMPDASMVTFGVNATAPEVLITDLVTKGTGFQTPNATFSVTPKNTTKIYANRQVFQGNEVTGFYYIDVIAEFQNNLLQQNQSVKHTIALVSNYFNNQSVTTGTSGDSVIYTHQGQPMKLSSFTVNILDQNRNNPALGKNNYIFLDIINNQPTVAMKEQQQAEIEAQQEQKKK